MFRGISSWEILKRQDPLLKSIMAGILWLTGICRILVIKRNGYLLRFYPTNLSAILWIDPLARTSDEDFFSDYLQAGDTVIDVGANIGTLALKASTIVGSTGAVFAIEPNPRISEFLRKNIELNKRTNIFVYETALGNQSGTIRLSNIRSDDQNSVVRDGRGISVKVCRLDDLPMVNALTALLKIDVEGYEKHVLLGGIYTLRNTQCVYFESSEQLSKRYGYSSRDIFILLNRCGFDIYKFTGRSRLSKIDQAYATECLENLVAIKDTDEFIQRTGYAISGLF